MKKFVCQNCHKLHKNSFDMNNDPNSSSGVFPAFADQKAVHNYGFICFDCKSITIGYSKIITMGFGEPVYVSVSRQVNGKYPEIEKICGVSSVSDLFPENCKTLWKNKLFTVSEEDKILVICTNCKKALRVKKNKEGFINCPLCSKKFYMKT